jgi:hypothetical protein
VATASMSGGYAPIAAHGTFPIPESVPAFLVGPGHVFTVRVTWEGGAGWADRTYQINWGAKPCEGAGDAPAPSLAATPHECPPGQHYSNVPPVGCEGTVAPPVTVAPVTNPSDPEPEPTTAAAVVKAEDPVEPAPAPAHVGPPKPKSTPKAIPKAAPKPAAAATLLPVTE